jgi:pimeloyl-ACP methyl ester carboxylesterase
MGLLAILMVIGILKMRGAFAPSFPAAEAGGTAIKLGKSGHRIVGRVYLDGVPQNGAPLVIVLHGDAPGRKPSYQYLFASKLAQGIPGSRIVALLRPGYADPFGGRSDGNRGSFSAGENYTPGVVEDLAAAIGEMKTLWGAQRVILIGHSGGAALTADIAALHPGLVQTAILVSCPCDVPAFRHHMAKSQWDPPWLFPVVALSPLATLQQMDAFTSVVAISGDEDPIALPQYSKSYISAANLRGLNASMISIPRQGHEILLLPKVIQLVVGAIQKTGQPSPLVRRQR